MIQRIQTIYLLLISVLIGQLFLFPPVIFYKEAEVIALSIGKTEPEVLPLTILFGLIVLISFITIFLFKKRILQIRLTIFNTVLMLGSVGLLTYIVYQFAEADSYLVEFKIFCSFPLITIILAYLTIRAIGKDEALVRSLDRIR